MIDTVIKWNIFDDTCRPPISGWYPVVLKPVNHEDLGVEGINQWMKKFGLNKMWYNSDNRHFWAKDMNCGVEVSRIIDDRVAFWAFNPEVPLLEKEVKVGMCTNKCMTTGEHTCCCECDKYEECVRLDTVTCSEAYRGKDVSKCSNYTKGGK